MRCEAQTARGSRCRHKATARMLRAGGELPRWVCNLHWHHPPRKYW
jgi:hypothetical protein